MAAETLLDIFINANILFCLAYGLWCILCRITVWTGMGGRADHDLRLLNLVFVAVMVACAVSPGLHALGVGPTTSVTLTDLMVSHYLRGNIGISALEMEGILLARDTFTLNLLNASGGVAQVLIAVFAAGLLLGLGRLALSVASLARILSQSFVWRRVGRVQLLLCDRTLVPFSTRGLRTYYVVIPSHMLERTGELKVALAHEFQHIRQGDIEWEILLEALKPFFYLNPAFHAWKRQVEALRELNCDRAVLLRGLIDPRTYCSTLLSVCQRTMTRRRRFCVAVPRVTLVATERAGIDRNGHSLVERRIRSVLTQPRPDDRRVLVALRAGVLVCAVALGSLALQKSGDWSQDRLTFSTVVNLERLAEINRQAQFGRVQY